MVRVNEVKEISVMCVKKGSNFFIKVSLGIGGKWDIKGVIKPLSEREIQREIEEEKKMSQYGFFEVEKIHKSKLDNMIVGEINWNVREGVLTCPHCYSTNVWGCSCGQLYCHDGKESYVTCNRCGESGELVDGLDTVNIQNNKNEHF